MKTERNNQKYEKKDIKKREEIKKEKKVKEIQDK